MRMSVLLSGLWVIWMAIIRSGWVLTTTYRNGVAVFDFTTVSGCDQLVVGITHARGGTNTWPPDDWCSWPSTVWSSVWAKKISLSLVINAGVLASSRRLILGEPVIAPGFIWKSLCAVKFKVMKPTRRLSVYSMTETGMFWWMSCPIISGGLLLSLRWRWWTGVRVGG